MRYRLAVFDFDGTLVDTRRPITLSVNRTLDALGYERRPVAEIEELIALLEEMKDKRPFAEK